MAYWQLLMNSRLPTVGDVSRYLSFSLGGVWFASESTTACRPRVGTCPHQLRLLSWVTMATKGERSHVSNTVRSPTQTAKTCSLEQSNLSNIYLSNVNISRAWYQTLYHLIQLEVVFSRIGKFIKCVFMKCHLSKTLYQTICIKLILTPTL